MLGHDTHLMTHPRGQGLYSRVMRDEGPRDFHPSVAAAATNQQSALLALRPSSHTPDMQISSAIAANYSSAVQVLTVQLFVFINVPMGL